MTIQKDKIRNYIFPICTAEKNDEGVRYEKFLGTGFLIGNNSFALTASHVVDGVKDGEIYALFVDNDNKWVAFEIIKREHHSSQDLSILKIESNNFKFKSVFNITESHIQASQRYFQFAYPADILRDKISLQDSPELIYFEGYIRRRISYGIPGIKGDKFFELSEIGSEGCSGSPIFMKSQKNEKWELLGIYVGARKSEKIDLCPLCVGYGLRADGFREWKPEILGKTIRDEMNNF